MLKSNVGWSIAKDSKTAGKEAAQKATENLTQTKVALLYTSADNNVEEVLEGAKEALGSIPVVGCTSSGGIIVPDGYITSENGFVGVKVSNIEEGTLKVKYAGTSIMHITRVISIIGFILLIFKVFQKRDLFLSKLFSLTK